MITAIIVDDEERSRQTLAKILNKYCNDVELLGQAASVQSAYELILANKPDLVFLDVEMPHETGFDLLEKFDQVEFEVVFTTAYDQYAINAIKFSVQDYLLKPIDIDELIDAVERVIDKKNKANSSTDDQIQALLRNFTESKVKSSKIGIPTQEGLEFILIDEVIRCEAEGSYTKLYLKGNRMILATGTIKEFEGLLLTSSFIRVHHSHLINANCISKYMKGEGGIVVMDDGAEVPISRRKKEAFLKQLQTL